MAMFAPIPLPNPNNNEAFKDVMDYFETIKQRKAVQQQHQEKLLQEQKQFEETKKFEREKMMMQNQLEQAKLSELMNYHRSKLAKANETPPLSAQERSEAMKLLESGRSMKSILEKTQGIHKLLTDNPNASGWGAGFRNMLKKPGKETSQLIEKSGNLQAAIGRLGSQRGGAQVLKWAEKIKPDVWKDQESNLGMTSSIMEDTLSDFNEAKNEYEALTGKPYPIKMPENGKGKKVKIRDNQTGKVMEVTEEEAKKLMEGAQ